MAVQNLGERQFKYLVSLNAIVFLGYLLLTIGYLFQFSARDIAENPFGTAAEFTPVLIIGMCSLVFAFTCGEFFGLLRYQFNATEDEPGAQGLRPTARRSLNVFFLLSISFYLLRPGLQESLLEKVFLTVLPIFLGSYLIFTLNCLNQAHMMAPWYYRLKFILLSVCLVGQLVANIMLFFPGFIATLLPISS
tara:strand:+ start:1032 stop:1607 length:576 start_codon:yes stop_codon:yes gene_type:complete